MAIVASDRSSVRATLNQPKTWQSAMKSAIRNAGELCRELGLPTEMASKFAEASFPVFAPRGYVAKMIPGDPVDPLLLQVLPQSGETATINGFVEDAVGDVAASRAPGLIHKYNGRGLLIATGTCAIHCRYSFGVISPTTRFLEHSRPGDLQSSRLLATTRSTR